MFEIKYSRKAKKFLADCEFKFKKRFELVSVALITNPLPAHEFDLLKIEGKDNMYRIRLSSFRILYEIFWNEKIIRVTKIERRKDRTYKF